MISNCRINEHGRTTGGTRGDQTGEEWRIQNWYSGPWYCVLRYPNATVANEMARIARDAANNNNIGYGQDTRTSFFQNLQQVNFNAASISTRCDADCSSAVCGCIVGAGMKLGDSNCSGVYPYLSTSGMRSALVSAGFQLLTDSRYLNSDEYLLPGDVLLKDGSHTAMNLDAGIHSGSSVIISDGGTGSAIVPEFIPRISGPDRNDKNFISVSRGGNNRCVSVGAYGSVLPNDVGYAWGRFMEVLGSPPTLTTGNANNWFKNTADGYQRGKTPKLGAVACWFNPIGAGHVAVVERIDEDGSILMSSSKYPNQTFFLESGSPPNYLSWKGYYLQGFIYNPNAVDTSGMGDNLYDMVNDQDDAVLREVGYMRGSNPVTSVTDVRLCVINYTSALGAFFEGAIGIPGGSFVGNVSVDISNIAAVQRAVFQTLQQSGLNAAACCGILGNIEAESGFRTNAVGDHRTSFGICQWHNERGTNMKNYVGANWANNLSGQVNFLIHELNTLYQYVWNAIYKVPNNESGARQAADIFVRKFERPSNVNAESIKRQANASKYWNQLAIQM